MSTTQPQLATRPTTGGDYDAPELVADALQADLGIGFLFRQPFALDAYQLGFITGFREDCRLQQDSVPPLEIPCFMLDNDFRDPDVDRYLEVFREYNPRLGVIGDAYTATEAADYVAIATELQEEFEFEPVIVPKCREALDEIPREITVGYANGYSDVLAHEFTDYEDWFGRRVHILGSSPTKQWAVIQRLVYGYELDQARGPTLGDFGVDTAPPRTVGELGHAPADIVSTDWNGLYQVATMGEKWTADGWKRADELTIRETVYQGLRNIRSFWQSKDVWPDTTPIEYLGEAVDESRSFTDQCCANCGDDLFDGEAVDAIIRTDAYTVRFCSDRCKDHFIYHEQPDSLEHRRLSYQRYSDPELGAESEPETTTPKMALGEWFDSQRVAHQYLLK